VTSLTGGRPGIIEDYLAHAERSPRPPGAEGPPPTPWVEQLGDELERAGVIVRPAYRVGRWAVDLCVGEDEHALAIEAAVHPDGPAAHIERHRSLRRAGWRIIEAYPTGFGGDPVLAAVTLAGDLLPNRSPRRPG
jgi:hypothetical protein